MIPARARKIPPASRVAAIFRARARCGAPARARGRAARAPAARGPPGDAGSARERRGARRVEEGGSRAGAVAPRWAGGRGRARARARALPPRASARFFRARFEIVCDWGNAFRARERERRGGGRARGPGSASAPLGGRDGRGAAAGVQLRRVRSRAEPRTGATGGTRRDRCCDARLRFFEPGHELTAARETIVNTRP